MQTRAAIYARISDDRAGAGLGVARQEADCRALAERNGWAVERVYVDNDVSAYDRRRKRQAWADLLAALTAGQYDVVIAWHPDRLYRQMRDLIALIDLCDRDRVKIATVTAGDVDLSTATGRAVAKTVAAWNEHESEHKAERNRNKARELADAGKVGNGGPRPFGYDDDRVRVREDEAAILRAVCQDVIAGRGLSTIARELAGKGVTTTTGRPFTTQGLRFTLLRARNVGWREHHGRLAAPAVWPGIIDRDVWDQVRAILTDPDRPNAGQAMYVRRYLLTGFLRCGVCGGLLKPNRNADLQRFACRPALGQAACGKILVRYDPCEQLVVDLLLARSDEIALDPEPDPTDLLRDKIARQEARLEALADAFADETGDVLEFRRAGQKIRASIDSLRRQITDTAQTARRREPGVMRQEWDGYDLAQKRTALAEMIDHVKVSPAQPGNTFQPDRLTVAWR